MQTMTELFTSALVLSLTSVVAPDKMRNFLWNRYISAVTWFRSWHGHWR